MLDQRGKGYICVTGVHGIMEAQRDAGFRAIHNRAFLCTPDGMPTVWVGHLQGHRRMRRVYGPDFMLEMCRLSVAPGYRHFLYGGNRGVGELLKRRLESLAARHPHRGDMHSAVSSTYSEEEDQLIQTVAAVDPDIIWVGLSTPKQEQFMARMIDRLDTRLMVGVGAAFDIHAGLLAEAPAWMKTCGLQWLHRLLQGATPALETLPV